jgi:hypothetical protein
MSRVASLDLAAAETADSIAARSERGLAVPVWANAVAAMAEHSLLLELSTYPKPGLVSDIDSGSHTDMDAAIFRRSAAARRPFFRELVVAGAHNADMATLRRIGLRAEAKMLAATRGVSTHRGAIFGLGLLCAAAGLRASGHDAAGEPLGRVVAVRWGRDILEGPRLADSHGQRATRRYGAGGALEEAAHGFPGVYEVGLTSLRATPGNVLRAHCRPRGHQSAASGRGRGTALRAAVRATVLGCGRRATAGVANPRPSGASRLRRATLESRRCRGSARHELARRRPRSCG